ncbi:hypothetical protein RIF29_24125 [Crotalaria pallida]|uniref:TF-B3 domain-containing protein n=1 Tax=Crotalaria pallida TaxID=3830 RepID=A0AAN9ELE1_CROPI
MTTPITKLVPTDIRSFNIHICEHNQEDETEKLPTEFVQCFSQSLPNPIILELPTKRTWKVELDCHDGDVWLKEGWNQFISDLSLQQNHILTFTYTDRSVFIVKAWEYQFCSEIQYPFEPQTTIHASTIRRKLIDHQGQVISIVKLDKKDKVMNMHSSFW